MSWFTGFELTTHWVALCGCETRSLALFRRLDLRTAIFFESVRGDKSSVRLIHADSGKSAYPPIELDSAVVDAVLSPDGKTILTKTKTDDLRLWDAATATPLTPAIHHGWGDYKFSPDSKYLAITFSDCLRLFDAHSGVEAKQRISERYVFACEFQRGSPEHRDRKQQREAANLGSRHVRTDCSVDESQSPS